MATSRSPIRAATKAASDALVARLLELTDDELREPSRLPGWNRLTIVCHLRYGASAGASMTRLTVGGREAAFYPLGRSRQRESTLRPASDETPHDAVIGLAHANSDLDEAWQGVGPDDWNNTVREPRDNPDLGPISLRDLALLRLTEVEVHSGDLDVGLDRWSATFVDLALPFRFSMLAARRAANPAADRTMVARWLLTARDGPSHLVAVDGSATDVGEVDGAVAIDGPGVQIIEGTRRELLAVLLGRPATVTTSPVEVDVVRAFKTAFPGP
jgi:maleylpyruvate isomerase